MRNDTENEWGEQKEKTAENKRTGEHYVRKNTTCKTLL